MQSFENAFEFVGNFARMNFLVLSKFRLHKECSPKQYFFCPTNCVAFSYPLQTSFKILKLPNAAFGKTVQHVRNIIAKNMVLCCDSLLLCHEIKLAISFRIHLVLKINAENGSFNVDKVFALWNAYEYREVAISYLISWYIKNESKPCTKWCC